MPDRNECTPGDYANFATVNAEHADQAALLASTVAAVESAAVDGLVNIQMAKGPVPVSLLHGWTNQGDGNWPRTDTGDLSVTPGPVVKASKQQAVLAIIRGDATLVV